MPLLALAVRRGEALALAMEARAFGSLPRRTYYRSTTVGWRDAWFALGWLAVLGVLAASAGLGRT